MEKEQKSQFSMNMFSIKWKAHSNQSKGVKEFYLGLELLGHVAWKILKMLFISCTKKSI